MKKKNLFRALNAVLWARLFRKRAPLFVSWQITRRCNLRCLYCDYWSRKKEEELNSQSVFRIIDDLAKLGTLAVSFTGGEPLLRDDIGEIISYADNKGIYSKINTNGILIPQKIDQIRLTNQVNLSFDGPEVVHDRVRGNGSFRAVLEAVNILKKMNKKIVFHVTLTKYNLASLDFILDKCKELDVGAFFQPATDFYLLNRNINPFSAQKEAYANAILFLLKEKRKNIYIYNSLSGLRHLYHWPDPKDIYCSAGKITFRINPEGQFYHCERFPDSNRFNSLEKGIMPALKGIKPFKCNECWCGPLVELNLAMGGNFDAIINTLKL